MSSPIALLLPLAEPRAFADAYDEHGAAVYAVALRVLGDEARAQDVAHDVFLELWRRPARFDPERGGLGLYLRLLARSRALDALRRGRAVERMCERVAIRDERRAPALDGHPELSLERAEDAARVRAALSRLPAPQREALVLAYWGELTVDEVARRLSVPLGTAKGRIRLGLAKLRAELADRATSPVAA